MRYLCWRVIGPLKLPFVVLHSFGWSEDPKATGESIGRLAFIGLLGLS
jgi:hypothetical protein